MDDHATLCWRVERACAAAWPARTTDVLHGWAVARSGGGTRRINSASPLSPGATLDPPGQPDDRRQPG
uniref:GNAT family N-acetyltransferase, cg3035/Rv0428c family n=1 Tax=uncultured Sphingomonas sp. TaxID=158754 RepID=UPI0025847FB7